MIVRWGRYSVLLLMPAFVSLCSSPPSGAIILCAGDSITEIAYPHLLQKICNREGIRARVLNYGRSGFTSGEYLSFLEMRHTKLAEERPDFILVQLGTNDVRVDGDATSTEAFTNNLREIIGIFRSFKSRSGREPKILLATIPPVPEGTPLPFSAQSVRRVKDEVNPAIADVAVKERLALVDNYALFFNAPHLLADVHPTQDGYRALAQNWFTALRPFLKPAR